MCMHLYVPLCVHDLVQYVVEVVVAGVFVVVVAGVCCRGDQERHLLLQELESSNVRMYGYVYLMVLCVWTIVCV